MNQSSILAKLVLNVMHDTRRHPAFDFQSYITDTNMADAKTYRVGRSHHHYKRNNADYFGNSSTDFNKLLINMKDVMNTD
jgi:hypothetical protein